jgi:bacteriocin biosynthesis cyclodehydratase domain-containing protein
MEKFHVIPGPDDLYQVRTRNELYTVTFDEPEKRAIFEAIKERYEKPKQGFSLFPNRWLNKLEKEYGKDRVFTVLEELRDFNLLPAALYKYLEPGAQGVSEEQEAPYVLSQVRLGLIGTGAVLELFEQQAKPIEFKSVTKLSTEKPFSKQQLEDFLSEVDFFIAEASAWNPTQFKVINKVAITQNKPWLYIEGLNLDQIKIGPIFYGKETGCYNCLIKRIKSNKEEAVLACDSIYEDYLEKTGEAAKPDYALYPQSLIHSTTGSLALMEVIKFFKYWSVPALWRNYIVLDVNSLQVTSHRLLKVPTCEVCKPKLEYNSSPWLESISLRHE